MSKSQGFILLHRKYTENFLYFSETFTRSQAWIDMIILANHKDNVMVVRGHPVKVPRGSIGMSQESLGQRWRWSRDKVKRFISLLKTAQMIAQTKNGVKDLYSIINYEQYQAHRPTSKSPKQHPSDIPAYQNNNETNKENNGQQTALAVAPKSMIKSIPPGQ